MSYYSLRKEIAFSIWKEVFQDSDTFMSLYFQEVYRDEDTLLFVDYKNNKGIAHVQILPYQIAFAGASCKAGYISGAATMPEHRASGLMPKLMRRALVYMYQRGDIFSFLIPAEEWLYSYYRVKAGYASVAKRALFSATSGNNNRVVENISSDCSVERYKKFIRSRKQGWRFPHIEHSYRQWRAIVKDAVLSGGGERDSFLVRYLGSVTQRVFTAEKFGEKLSFPEDTKTQIVTPYFFFPDSHLEKHGMLRIIRVEDALQLYAKAHPKKKQTWDLMDAEIPKNTGRYRVFSGKVLFQSLPSDKLSRQALTPSQLAEEIFSEDPLYIDLMLD